MSLSPKKGRKKSLNLMSKSRIEGFQCQNFDDIEETGL